MYIYPDNRYIEFLQNVRSSLPCYVVSHPPKLFFTLNEVNRNIYMKDLHLKNQWTLL